ncbi:MAG: hypothetical protein A2505_10225 [Deltaproteobacteria bacterium RIFOXYD12_FULL_55_16]|nr:MAG: hypothetical protein A2505_10225 [Deltaproteobacteria bacterium RIFOXYD12_FULL_55_16]
MNLIKIAAILLIVVGALSLVYSNLSYSTEIYEVKMGLIEQLEQEGQECNISFWAGIIALEIGSALLLLGYKKVQT